MEALSCIALGGFILMALPGCAENAPVNEDPATTAKRVETAKDLRSYFDKSNGNYDTMSPEDQAKVNKITGSETNTRTAFGHMGPPVRKP